MARRPKQAQPKFLIDICLGKRLVIALRETGMDVRSLIEVYGEETAHELPDTEWLNEAGQNDWNVLTKDSHIRRRPTETRALTLAGVKVFCLAGAQLSGDEQISRFLENRYRIEQASRKRGPAIYVVYRDGLRRFDPQRHFRT